MSIFRRKTPKERIEKALKKLKGNLDGLVILFRLISDESWKAKILSMILTEPQITLNELEELATTSDNECFDQVCEKILQIGIDLGELAYLFIHTEGKFADWAFRQFVERINSKTISDDYAGRVLLEVITTCPHRRSQAWNIMKKLKSGRDRLRRVADLENSPETYEMAKEAQKMMAKLSKKDAIKAAKAVADLIKKQG